MLFLMNCNIFAMKSIIGCKSLDCDNNIYIVKKNFDSIPLDVLKYEIFQFLDSETLKNMKLANRAFKDLIDNFIIKEKLFDTKNKDKYSFLGSHLKNKNDIKEIVKNIKLRFEKNKYDSFPFLYEFSDGVKNIVFLNKNNFREKLDEVLKNLSSKDLSIFNEKIERIISFSPAVLSTIAFMPVVISVLMVKICEKSEMVGPIIFMGPMFTSTVFVVFLLVWIKKWRNKILKVSVKRSEKEKEDLRNIIYSLD